MKMSSGHYFWASRHVFGLLEPYFGHVLATVLAVFLGDRLFYPGLFCVRIILAVCRTVGRLFLLISLKSLLSASENDLFIAVPPWYYRVPPRYFIVPLVYIFINIVVYSSGTG